MKSDKAYLYFKLSFVGSFILLFGTFLLCYMLFRYAPGLHVISQFYTKGIMKSDQQSETIPFEAEGNNKDLIDNMLIRYYIETRYTVFPDQQEMVRRWKIGSPFSQLTTKKLYEQFIGDDFEKKVTKLPKVVSTVDIISVQQDSKDNNLYTVDFDIYGRGSAGEHNRQKKRATLKVGHGRARNTATFANPYGTFIGYFSEKNRNN